MNEAEVIRNLLLQSQVVALVGASPKPERASYRVMQFLLNNGYRVIPVNPLKAGAEILGVRTKDDSSSVLFSWNQKEQAFRIELKGPLGQTGGIVSGDQHFATLEIPGEQAIAAASPEELLALRFEWELPVRNAQYWVKGIPAPDSPFDATYADNRLATLTQDGWIITYHRYLDAADVVLPEKLTLAREDLKLTIIFSDWYLID